MAEALLKEPIVEIHEPAPVRRFEVADLSTHGGWLIKRFQALFPDMSERGIAGYLNGLITSNDNLFLYQDHGVALAQMVYSGGARPIHIIQERFVWVEDKTDKQQLEFAADFYTHIHLWAKRASIERIIVCENTDVPKSLIEARIGRIFDTKVSHVRV